MSSTATHTNGAQETMIPGQAEDDNVSAGAVIRFVTPSTHRQHSHHKGSGLRSLRKARREATRPPEVDAVVETATTGPVVTQVEPQLVRTKQQRPSNYERAMLRVRIEKLKSWQNSLRQQHEGVLPEFLRELKQLDPAAAHAVSTPVEDSIQFLRKERHFNLTQAVSLLERKLGLAAELLHDYAPYIKVRGERRARELELRKQQELHRLEDERLLIHTTYRQLVVVLEGKAADVVRQPVDESLRHFSSSEVRWWLREAREILDSKSQPFIQNQGYTGRKGGRRKRNRK